MTKQRIIPDLANKGFCPKIENIIVSGNSLVVLSTAQVIMSALTLESAAAGNYKTSCTKHAVLPH